jgi:hypothetical protein
MSKTMIEAFVKSQYNSLGASDNKERIKHIIAGCKDGHLYSHDGTDYGLYDENAEDAIFVPESDLELARITGSKIAGITLKMQKFFDANNGAVVEEVEEVEEAEEVEDQEVIEKACKKAIKKGDFKKAQKIIDKLGGHKKLQKKLDKAQS